MEYTISFNVGVRERSGYTKVGFTEELEIEVEKLSNLAPLLLAIEHQITEFKKVLKPNSVVVNKEREWMIGELQKRLNQAKRDNTNVELAWPETEDIIMWLSTK